MTKAGSDGSRWRRLQEDWRHLVATLFLLGAALFSYKSAHIGVIAAVLVNCYLILLLWSVANRADRSQLFPLPLPWRGTSLIMFAMMFVAQVVAFGNMFAKFAKLQTAPGQPLDGIGPFGYSLATIMTLGGSGRVDDPHMRDVVVAAELLSAVLLLACAIPLLISRLATWGADSNELSVFVFDGLEIHASKTGLCRMTVQAKIRLVWEREGRTVTIEGESNGNFVVTGSGDPKTLTDDQVLIITQDGVCLVGEK